MSWDLLDRQIAQALQVDGRAAFSAIAAVLGVSDQTVARRYKKLRSGGAVRVVGLAQARRLGQVEWLIRLRCVPDAAAPIATALAKRPDTTWVSLTSGGTEIVCFSRAGRDEQELLGKLPRMPRVVAVSAHCLLRTFYGGATGWSGRPEALTTEQMSALRPTFATGAQELTGLDEALLAELAIDGRTSYARLATVTGWSESTVQRRLDALRGSGALFFDLDIAPELLGIECEALLWLSVPPSQIARIGTALAEHTEVAFAAAVTGPANVVAFVACRDVDALYDYVANRLGAIEEITQLETAPVIRGVKRAGALLPTS